MVAVGQGLAAGFAALVALLAVLAVTAGIGALAVTAGLACGVVLGVVVLGWTRRYDARRLGPADVVTLTRATLACAVAALVADAFRASAETATLVALAAVALVLDAVDGPVARRTGTTSALGAKLDGEVDAFLILVLSVHVAGSFGAWVLVIGAARYAFGAAGWPLAWMRRQLPFRYWRKVVTAVQGVVLTSAAAGLLPVPLVYAALVVAVTLLAESFGRDVVWLWRRRRDTQAATSGPPVRVRVSTR